MRALQRFAISRPVTTAMFYLGLVLMGLIAFFDLEVNLLPNLEFPRLTVITSYPNASPREVENLITRPISESIGTVSGIRKISSESLEGLSLIRLQFAWGTRTDFAAMEVREKTDLIRGLLPEDASRSIVSRFDPNQAPFMELVFFSRGLSKPRDLRHFLTNEVKIYLDRIDGVAAAQLSGGHKKEVQINVDPTLMTGYNLSLGEISDAISTSNINVPAGNITAGSKDILIRTLGEYRNLNDIERTVIGRNKAGVPIRLRRVAKVVDGYRERTGLARYNGRECVIVSLYKEAGKNTVKTSDNVRAAVTEIQDRFKRELEVQVVYDESRFIKQSINNISQSLVVGGMLAFLALVLILRNLRSPFIVVTVIPISVLTTFMLMHMRGISLNMMSLGGLALGIGMLFDSANVVLSAIERHIRNGVTPREAALRGAGEVSGSITAAVLTTIIVFLPIIFLEGIVGVVFAEMATTITFSLSVSLLVSLTLIPMLSSLRPTGHVSSFSRTSLARAAESFELSLEKKYERRLIFFLERPRLLMGIVFVLLAIAIALFPLVRREFIPRVDTGEFSVKLRAPKGTTLKATADIATLVEEKLAKHPQVRHVLSRVGYDEDQILTRQGGDVGTHRISIRVVLRNERSDSSSDISKSMRGKTKLRDDIRVNFEQSGDILSKLLSPGGGALTLDLTGDDLGTLADIGNRLKQDIGRIRGVTDIRTSMEEKAREFHLEFDELRMSGLGLTNSQVSRFLRSAVKGDVATRLRVADEEIDIRVRLRRRDRQSLDNIRAMRFKAGDGREIHLAQVVSIKEKKGFTSVLRTGPSRVNRITADGEKDRLKEIFSEVEDYLERIKLPEGYKLKFSGEKEDIEKSFRDLFFAFLLAVVLIYMLLSAQVESTLYPVLMMGAVPLIIIGIIPALFLTGKSLNINSITGMILLIGIVVDNSVLFHEYVEILRREGKQLREAILGSGKIVLRPIIMNNSTTLLGLAPVAFELGEGTEFQSPMAIAVISGLLTAVFLSLFIIPTMFYVVLKWKDAK